MTPTMAPTMSPALAELEERFTVMRINGGIFMRPRVAGEMELSSVTLSARELEVLRYVAEGNSNKKIARILLISEQTVKNHLTSIMEKLQANDRTHAVVQALRQGWISV